MDWHDNGIILSVRPHGENAVIAAILTEQHGRHLGLVRGGQGRRLAGLLQPGNEVRCVWRARLAEHLGAYTLEPIRARAALFMDDRGKLAALSSACALCDATLAEREAHPALFAALSTLLDTVADLPVWPAVYVRFELGLLQELGFALDLSKCAATGATDELIYVSPKSARAVSRAAGAPYRERLLPLPGFLLGSQGADAGADDIRDGLKLTGHFLQAAIFHHKNQQLPVARDRLLEIFSADDYNI